MIRSIPRPWRFVAMAVLAPLCALAQTHTPATMTSALYDQPPYMYTGLMVAQRYPDGGGFSGSGAVVGHPRLVYSCAHLVFDEASVDPWMPYVRWFRGWRFSTPPSSYQGQTLRGYRCFQGYASAKLNQGSNFSAQGMDFAVHYAYEDTAGGSYAPAWEDTAIDRLRSSATKLITGYPSGLYASGDPKRYLMHQTGPFTQPFAAVNGNFMVVTDVLTGPGNSGGPIWVSDGTTYLYAGVVTTMTQRSNGGSTDSTGIYALNTASRSLIGDAIAHTTPPPPEITIQPSDRRVYEGASTSLDIGFTGLNPRFQWYLNGQPIAGAVYSAYHITAVTVATAGSYHVVVSDAGGQAVSQQAIVAIEPPPGITAHPISLAVSPGEKAAFSVTATGLNLTYSWYKNGFYIGMTNGPSYTIKSATSADDGLYSVEVSSFASQPIRSQEATLTVVSTPAEMQRQPVNQRKKAGGPATLIATAKAADVTYQWYHNGLPIAGATQASYTIPYLRPKQEGSYRVLVNAAGSLGWSETAMLAVESSRLVNVSTRGYVPPGGELIPGFVLRGGSDSKPVLARAAGPALKDLQVFPALEDPGVSLISQDTKAMLVTNRNWIDSASMREVVNRLGASPFRTGSLDAAATLTLPVNSGGYTVRVGDDSNTGGIVLAEVYEAEYGGASQIINVSTRGFVGTNDNILIAGFVINGNTGKPLLIRAIGPGLARFDVGERLANPQLKLVRQTDGQVLSSNDDWGSTTELKAAFAKSGAFELADNSRDAAIIVMLDPGVYTVMVSGVSDTTGNVLVEVYDLDF